MLASLIHIFRLWPRLAFAASLVLYEKMVTMKAEQLQQAQRLYFQTDSSKSEIAETVGISRRTLHYWIRQNHWDHLKTHSGLMPTVLAANCYLILGKMQENILSPERADQPVTLQEVNAMHRMVVTIGKLNQRGTLSEQLEMLSAFTDFIEARRPDVVPLLDTLIGEYANAQAADHAASGHAVLPHTVDEKEQLLDQQDLEAWAADPPPDLASLVPGPATSAGKTAVPAQEQTIAPTQPPAPKLNRAARRRLARAA